MMKKALLIILLFYLFNLTRSFTSAVVVLKPFSSCYLPAKYARRRMMTRSALCGSLHVADPLNACSSLRIGAPSNKSEHISIALIVRGECSFQDKILNAQDAGFSVAIVYNDNDKERLVYMMANPEIVNIPAIFVSKASGEIFKELAKGEDDECCIYPSYSKAAWSVLAISFISVILIFAFVLVVIIVRTHWLSRRRQTNGNNKCVDKKLVESFSCIVYCFAHTSSYHGGETCPICLEDYRDGVLLKVLPCKHGFHASCVDVWLTKWATFCPVCKLDIRTKSAYSKAANNYSIELLIKEDSTDFM